MAKKRPFVLVYSDIVRAHLRAIDAKYHSLIRAEIEARLPYEPEVESRSRKPLKRPIEFGADWELRLGPDNRFRVFYRVDAESRRVLILAIGVKIRAQLFFDGEEFFE